MRKPQAAKTRTAILRTQQVLAAIDRIAARNALAFLTTQRVSRESGVSDGVLFRLFANREAMLAAWVESRGARLRALLAGTPAGPDGLGYAIRCLLQDEALLSFVCCQEMDVPYLRAQMAGMRRELQVFLRQRVELHPMRPPSLPVAWLCDHLMLSLYRAWDPENERRAWHKERLMSGLPWEQDEAQRLPDPASLQQLAINDSGFVFNPSNGQSFTANEVGLFLLRLLQQGYDMPALLATVCADFAVDEATAERDITEFLDQLRRFLT